MRLKVLPLRSKVRSSIKWRCRSLIFCPVASSNSAILPMTPSRHLHRSPNRNRRSPIAIAANGPIACPFQPFAKTAMFDMFWSPMNLLVEASRSSLSFQQRQTMCVQLYKSRGYLSASKRDSGGGMLLARITDPDFNCLMISLSASLTNKPSIFRNFIRKLTIVIHWTN